MRRCARVGLAVALVTATGFGATLATRDVTVVQGDTLSAISRRTGVSVASIVQANDIANPDLIRIGEVLVIPDSVAASALPVVPDGFTTYVVVEGDTLRGIARRFGTTAATLSQANALTNPNLIRIGSALLVPTAPTASATPAASAAPTTTAVPAAPPAPTTTVTSAPAVASTPDPAATAPPPAPATTTTTVAPPSQPRPSGGVTVTYVVRPGDTLSTIASRFGVSVSALLTTNRMGEGDTLREGQRLVIPLGGLAEATIPSNLARSPSRLDLSPVFDRWASEYQIPSALLKAVAWIESGWQNRVVSSAGALGIGQLLPETVQFVEENLLDEDLDADVPEDNIRMSARFLAYLLEETESVDEAIAAYAQGLGSVQRNGVVGSVDPYVSAVLATAQRF